MTDRVGGAACRDMRDNVCVDVDRIYDCCKDRDCIMDTRVYVPVSSQPLIDSAINVRANSAEILWTYIDVEALPYNRGFYTVDVKFFFRVRLDVFVGVSRPQTVEGLSVFDKRIILFGSEGSSKIFSSSYVPESGDINHIPETNLPKASVEVVDPIVLSARILTPCENTCCGETDLTAIPDYIRRSFDENLIDLCDHNKVLVTLGLFSVVRLTRNVQIVVPCSDFCVPEKECCGPTEQDPCSVFYQMEFPISQFFPPRTAPRPSPCDGTADRQTRG